jgi:dTMP kinase
VQKIHREDANEAIERRKKQLETAEMVRKYEQQRQQELLDRKAAAKAEEDAINAYNQAVANRDAGVAAQKQAKKDEEDRILAKIVEETERKRKEEEEFSDLRDMLWAEELEAARAKDAQARKDKAYRQRKEMMDANDKMLAAKAEQRIKDAEKEARLIGLMRKKFAEDEARERAEEEARKASKAHHMVLVEQQRTQRRAMYDEEKEGELAATQEAARREDYRKQVIAEAKKRLLDEHAARLQEYMPRL